MPRLLRWERDTIVRNPPLEPLYLFSCHTQISLILPMQPNKSTRKNRGKKTISLNADDVRLQQRSTRILARMLVRQIPLPHLRQTARRPMQLDLCRERQRSVRTEREVRLPQPSTFPFPSPHHPALGCPPSSYHDARHEARAITPRAQK
jgi:hypothetical protein